eukprot:scaffold12497_cov19-Tisochrysis_lutea.AAC.1
MPLTRRRCALFRQQPAPWLLLAWLANSHLQTGDQTQHGGCCACRRNTAPLISRCTSCMLRKRCSQPERCTHYERQVAHSLLAAPTSSKSPTACVCKMLCWTLCSEPVPGQASSPFPYVMEGYNPIHPSYIGTLGAHFRTPHTVHTDAA